MTTKLFHRGSKKPKPLSLKITFVIAFIIMLVYCLGIVYFFLYGFMLSTKRDQIEVLDDMLNQSLFSFSKEFTFKHYIECFKEWQTYTQHTYLETLWNSIWRTILSSVLTWFTTAIVTYVCVHYSSKFTKAIYMIGLVLVMIPIYGAQGAQYRLFSQLNLINNPWINITSITLFGGYFFYMYAFWKKVSHAYIEAGQIDGANHYQIFFKIMLPQAIPSLFALYIMQFISAWNDYESTAVYMTKYPNLSYGTYAILVSSEYMGNVPMYFAGVILGLLPVLILFLIFQNSIMEKVYLGGIKG